MSVSKDEKGTNLFEKVLQEYVCLLQQRPVLTKSVTSACVSVLGSVISQLIVRDPNAKGRINWRSVVAYGSCGFILNGPILHRVYLFMEKYMPQNQKYSTVKRLIFDRLFFTPLYMAIYLYSMYRAEGLGGDAAIQRLKEVYWMILKLNWTLWTCIQYVNFNYIPLKFRTIFGNVCGLIYVVIIAILRRRASR